MIDQSGGSIWSHLDGVAVHGPLEGQQLEIVALQTTTWSAWREQYPQTTVPVNESRYSLPVITQLGGFGLGSTFLATLPHPDDRLPENELVVGVLAGGETRAFPLRRAPEDAPMQGIVGGVPVVVLEDRDGTPSLAFHRTLSDGRLLDFERRDGAIYDRQTGSRWNASGLSVEGALAGVPLTFVTSFLTEWYGWAAFHWETTIFGEQE